jgi:hypothetical protein
LDNGSYSSYIIKRKKVKFPELASITISQRGLWKVFFKLLFEVIEVWEARKQL